jgi:hypothetical protein
VTGQSQSATHNDFVKVAHVTDEAEAELVQGLLRTADVGSVVRRAPGFDVPEFLAAGPREVLVAASDVPLARDVLREVDPGVVDRSAHACFARAKHARALGSATRLDVVHLEGAVG